MHLMALTFGDESSASTQYRLFQYTDFFSEAGIDFEWQVAKGFTDFSSLANYDVVLLQKTLLSASTLRRIRKNSKYLIYDADDRIWLSPSKEHHWLTRLRINFRVKEIAKLADVCTVANQVIGNDLEKVGAKVKVIPMSLNARIWIGKKEKHEGINIGWSGAPKNLEFLHSIEPELREIQRKYPDINYIFHCGQDPQFELIRYRHLPYVPGSEPTALAHFDIGLVPLSNNPFVRGKSPIKSLQYSASSLAIVASPVGAIHEILTDGVDALYADSNADWKIALEKLITDDDLRCSLANKARQNYEKKFSSATVFPLLMNVLENT
jgi:hypothetical protein